MMVDDIALIHIMSNVYVYIYIGIIYVKYKILYYILMDDSSDIQT